MFWSRPEHFKIIMPWAKDIQGQTVVNNFVSYQFGKSYKAILKSFGLQWTEVKATFHTWRKHGRLGDLINQSSRRYQNNI